jgi:hypothetical protein
MLKSHGAGVYSSDAKGHTLLDSAVIYGSVEVAEWLLEEVGVHGDMSGKGNPLHVAALNGNARMVRMLLAKGRWGANERDAKNAMTPLHYLGDKLLAEHQSDHELHVRLRTEQKMTAPPANTLDAYDPPGVVKALLEAGADWQLKGE